MTSSLQRLASNSSRAYRSALTQSSRGFPAELLVEIKPGGIGMVSGIPEEHLCRRVKGQTPLLKAQPSLSSTRLLCTAALETQTQKLERIADELLSLTKLERHDYAVLFRHKMGLNRYGPAVSGLQSSSSSSASGAGSADAKAAAAEKTVFDVKLEKFDAAAKIKVIKEIRGFTDLGLKEAKDLVEKAPIVIKKGITKDEADSIVEKLKQVGATVVLE